MADFILWAGIFIAGFSAGVMVGRISMAEEMRFRLGRMQAPDGKWYKVTPE